LYVLTYGVNEVCRARDRKHSEINIIIYPQGEVISIPSDLRLELLIYSTYIEEGAG
jgi:hypothetical protein